MGDDAAYDVVGDAEEDAGDEACALLAAARAAEGEGQGEQDHRCGGERGQQALPEFEALLLVVEAVGRHEAGQGVEFAQGFGGFDGGEGL